jgi:ATP-dependent exoDNAse (exonuclease V) beta subunit
VSAHDAQPEYRLFSGRTLGFAAIEARRLAVAAAEQVRTLYVAMTRAKSRLVLAGKWPAERRLAPPERARSQMRLLLARQPAAPDLDGVMSSLARDRRHFIEDGDVRWVFPSLAPATASGSAGLQGWRLDVAATQAAAERLDQLVADAASRRSRRFVAAVSETVADLRDDGDGRDTGAAEVETRDRRVARAAGVAVHATLEAWLPPMDPRAVLRQQTPRLGAMLRGMVSASELREALESAAILLDRFDAGACGVTFRAIANHILARELPVVVPPADGDGPTGCYTGTIDLVYRDPTTGDLVVADYKTDHVERHDEIARRVASYRQQGAHYTRAVREALQLTTTPRFELWFLHPGRIEVVDGL